MLYTVTVGSLEEAVDSEPGVLLLDVARLDAGQRVDGREPAVLGQRQGDALQRLGERPHRVLLQGRDLHNTIIREMFYLTTHSTHFIYGYMASDIW